MSRSWYENLLRIKCLRPFGILSLSKRQHLFSITVPLSFFFELWRFSSRPEVVLVPDGRAADKIWRYWCPISVSLTFFIQFKLFASFHDRFAWKIEPEAVWIFRWQTERDPLISVCVQFAFFFNLEKLWIYQRLRVVVQRWHSNSAQNGLDKTAVTSVIDSWPNNVSKQDKIVCLFIITQKLYMLLNFAKLYHRLTCVAGLNLTPK